jgi:transposase
VLEVVKLPDVKRGFVLLPRRWVVERERRRLERDMTAALAKLEGDDDS